MCVYMFALCLFCACCKCCRISRAQEKGRDRDLSNFPALGGARNPEREAQVRALNRVAHAAGVATLPENASRAKVGKLAEDLCLLALTQQQRSQVNHAIAAFRATFSAANVEARDTGAPAPAQGKVWKFSAVQLTYNSSHSDFMALDHGVLENLFGRFVAYLGRLADQISAEGVSATMERASPERVHLHAYLHLSTAFHRRGQDALNIFAFEGVRPHVTPNTASGKTYTGAVRFGHFYVVADKLGTLRLGSRCLEAYRAAWGLGTNCGLKF